MIKYARILCLIPLISLCGMMCSCVPHTELNERIIVQALGIDGKDGEYTVTVQFYHTGGTGGQTQIDSSQSNVLTAEGKGTSIYSALTEAGFNNGKSLLYGENRVIILGKSVCEENLETTLSFFTSDYQCNPNITVAAAEDKASDILAVKYKEGIISTEKLSMLLKNAQKQGFILESGLYKVMCDLQGGTRSACIPVMSVKETGTDTSEDGKEVQITGGKLFTEFKSAGDLDITEMSGLCFIRNETEEASVSFEHEQVNMAIGLFNCVTRIKVHAEEQKLKFVINVSADGKFYENHTSFLSSGATEEVSSLAEKSLKKRIENSAEAIANENGADVLKLEYVLRNQDYRLWLKHEDKWAETIKNSEFEVNCDINIMRFGLED